MSDMVGLKPETSLKRKSKGESTNPVNLPRYEALGFERLGEFEPAGGPVITTMWRNPRR